jgi:hypothetical protein
MGIESIRISSFMTRNVKTETEDQNMQTFSDSLSHNDEIWLKQTLLFLSK